MAPGQKVLERTLQLRLRGAQIDDDVVEFPDLLMQLAILGLEAAYPLLEREVLRGQLRVQVRG